ncbi:transporter [Haloferacaceae archaeon DSL9]
MELLDTVTIVMYILHVGFAALWTGGILFLVGAVLPAASNRAVSAPALASMAQKLAWLTRLGAVVFVVSGGHMAGTAYTAERLFGTGSGHLVLAMLGLWLLLTALVETGAKRLRTTAADDPAAAVDAARPIFLAAAVVAVLLLVDAGLLASGRIV